jgi:hypothetical protein
MHLDPLSQMFIFRRAKKFICVYFVIKDKVTQNHSSTQLIKHNIMKG